MPGAKTEKVKKSAGAEEEINTVGKWMLHKINTANWRAGKMEKDKHYSHGAKSTENAKDSILEMMEAAGGRQKFLEQVRMLSQAGLISVEWKNVNTDVKKITISMEQVDALCEYEGVENKKKTVAERKHFLEQQMKRTNCEWLISYEQDLYRQLEAGKIPENVRDENIFDLLTAIAGLNKDIWKRKFSSNVLGESKLFQTDYEDKIITILRKYSPIVEDTMENEEILAEHGIITYSQTLQWKGDIKYEVGGGIIDTAAQIFGTVLNAQSLSHAKILSLKNVKKIITIENQANYENMSFDPEILYIYVHGFLSPKERLFLSQIEKIAPSSISFFHWSDLDYGGIRIFHFMKQKVFPEIHPLYMDKAAYDRAMLNGGGFELTKEKRKKLEKIEGGEVEELRQCILANGREFEQETLLVMGDGMDVALLNPVF